MNLLRPLESLLAARTLLTILLLAPLAAITAADAPQAMLDLALEPPVVNTKPGPEYDDQVRVGNMVIGIERTPQGRLWACWVGNGDSPNGFFMLATSDDGGATWSQIIERQLVVERLANMAIEMFATACVLARTQHLIALRGAASCERELAMCELFCVESGRRFRDARQGLDAKDEEVDDRRRAVAAAVRKAQGYFVTDALLDVEARPRAVTGP